MITIKITRNLGLTVATLPDSIFPIITNINEDRNGNVMFDVADETRASMVRSEIERAVNSSLTFALRMGYREIVAAPPVRPAPQVPQEAPFELEIREEDDEDDEEEEEVGVVANHVEAFRDVEASGSAHLDLQSKVAAAKLTDEQIPLIIASKLDNSTSNTSKMLSDKIIQYNKLMGSLIILQNEITRLSRIIGSDVVISKLMSEVEKLRATDNIVEEVFFTSNHMVIRTKDIVTDPLSDGRRRKVGKMDFIIDISVMVGIQDSGRNPIYIRNRTRSCRELECGHVGHSGLPCFGTWTEPIMKAMKDCDIVQLFEILVRYVRQPNLGDCMGRPMLKWPIVEEATHETR